MNDDEKYEGPMPPAETRWKKGVSGNPRGRPRKNECLTSLLKQELEKVCPIDSERRTWKELIALTAVQQALKADRIMIREMWDRVEGLLSELSATEIDLTIQRRRKKFDPDEPIKISRESANKIRAIYGLEPLREDS